MKLQALGGTANGLILVIGIVVVWQLTFEFAGEKAIAPPLQTLFYLGKLSATEAFWRHLAETGRAFAIALAIAVAVGLCTGFVLGLNKFAGEVAEPFFVALYSIPKITLYPIVLLAFGIGMPAKIAFGAIHGVVPIVIFTLNAVRSINPVLLKSARVMRLGPLKTVRSVVFPAALPEIFTGIRIGFSLTLIGTVLGEMFGSQRGLGYLLMTAIGLHNVDVIMAVTLLLVVFAATVSLVLIHIDRRLHQNV